VSEASQCRSPLRAVVKGIQRLGACGPEGGAMPAEMASATSRILEQNKNKSYEAINSLSPVVYVFKETDIEKVVSSSYYF
jgi:hypothetical protein